MSSFPHVPVEPGDHQTEWLIGDRRIAGDLTCDPLRPPRLQLFDDVSNTDWAKPGTVFPIDLDLSRIAGRTRSGQDIVVTDARLSVWMPDRTVGSARHVVVGMDIGGIEGDRYHRVRLQVTGAEMFFGIAPIKGVRWPSYTGGQLDGDFTSMPNSESVQTWDDPDRGIEIRCTYDSRMTNDPFEHRVSFAPVVERDCRA